MIKTLLSGSLPVRIGLLYSLVCLAVSSLLIVFSIRPADVVPLHYSSRYGVDALGPWFLAFYFPITGIALFVITAWLLTRPEILRQPISYFLVVSLALGETLLMIESFYLSRLVHV